MQHQPTFSDGAKLGPSNRRLGSSKKELNGCLYMRLRQKLGSLVGNLAIGAICAGGVLLRSDGSLFSRASATQPHARTGRSPCCPPANVISFPPR